MICCGSSVLVEDGASTTSTATIELSLDYSVITFEAYSVAATGTSSAAGVASIGVAGASGAAGTAGTL